MSSFKKAIFGLKDKLTKTSLERSIAEACSNENWGSQNSVLREIAERTMVPDDRRTIMRCTWESLRTSSNNWRQIMKTLNLIEFLLKFGSSACIAEIREESLRVKAFTNFCYREDGIEKGLGIREKSVYIYNLLTDNAYFQEEKEAARRNIDKCIGISHSDYKYPQKKFVEEPQQQKAVCEYKKSFEKNEKEIAAPKIFKPKHKDAELIDLNAKIDVVQQPKERQSYLVELIDLDPILSTEKTKIPCENLFAVPETIEPQPKEETCFKVNLQKSNDLTISELKSNPTMLHYVPEPVPEPKKKSAEEIESELFNLNCLLPKQNKTNKWY